MANSTSPGIQTRPYRSHRVPACVRCRSRKIRCHIDIPGEPCLSCRERRLKCQYDGPSITTDESNEERPSKRSKYNNGLNNGDGDERPMLPPVLHRPSSHASASIMLAPHVAEDMAILQKHIVQHGPNDADSGHLYQTLSHDAGNLIVYHTVPRYRTGLRPEMGAGKAQRDIIEQIIGPFRNEVIDLFLKHIQPHFPILDDESCSALRKRSLDKIPNTVACVVYATGAPFWRRSDILKIHPKPDSYYMWTKAIASVIEDFLSPALSTVCGAILDQTGRPSMSIISNITSCGRTVSLAQTFGLHRDPSTWNITDHEKATRIRLWWGVIITDYWGSVAYGTPPHIAKGAYDVPIPDIDSLISVKATTAQKYASTCFIHLCALTELLGDILPLVYHIKPIPEKLEKRVQKLKDVLSDLESQLPEWVPLPNRTGSSNLWFCLLSVRVLLNRVALRAAMLTSDTTLQASRLGELRSSSTAVLDFVLSLGESQFQDFWLPYTAHMLVLSVMVSLRCAVEAPEAEVRSASISKLERVIIHIQHAKDTYDWDLANHCLERYSNTISKIASLAVREPRSPAVAEAANETDGTEPQSALTFEDPTFPLSDLLDPNSFDFSWEALWDTPSGMTNFSL
ncbi:C6 transcription factor-like protein [Amniculicola lignicola CBS 123094]|uniref:C6 transcription factor-like protein n=1 Tax=Amniculicola lignicola CBS 123094 TaxID=1392246 RepID=A0A6A5WVN3_9PLEO|nr:C6 transcription factor-like protein [Amniculicola lignicola CBS 123094]